MVKTEFPEIALNFHSLQEEVSLLDILLVSKLFL